jgi:transcriptional regulator with PAS, ATPase and Fis domain
MLALRDAIRRAAGLDTPVVVCGATGSGKELVARALHQLSPHSHGPFCPVNVAALPEALLESEVFGSARGAFTGAVANRAGLAETAHGGSLFLDEAGDLPRHLQAKLLRVLESGEVRRVGAVLATRSSFRLTVAVQEEPSALEHTGRWREDFYFRVTGVVLRVPALREHPDDIEAIARAFLRSRSLPELETDALSVLTGRDWPGNVRELHQVLLRAAFHAQHGTLGSQDLLTALHDTLSPRVIEEPQSLHAMRHVHVCRTVQACNGDTRRAAELLGISRTHVYRLLKGDGRGLAEAG